MASLYVIVPKTIAFCSERERSIDRLLPSLNVYFSASYGNDHPYWMDYQRCEHLFTILYRLLTEGIRGYFSDDVSCTVNVSIDVLTI